MNKNLKKNLQYLLWICVSIALLYFSFRGVNWQDFGTALKSCRWEYILLSMAAAVLVLYVRGLRWRMQLLPIDPSISSLTCWNAYNICMIVNLVLPRVGEVARCGVVRKNSARDAGGQPRITLDKALGTVVMDRIWDGVSLAVVLVLMLLVMWDRFGSFFTDTLFPGVRGKAHLWWIVGVAVLVIVGFVWLCWRLRDRGRFWSGAWNIVKGVRDGLVTCLHMRNGWLFIVYTAIIWFLYWVMCYTVVLSLQGIDTSVLSPELAGALARVDTLGPADALFLMFAGSLSSLIPVPGGFGAFHSVVAGALSSLYGIPFNVGLIFATLSHESQVIVDAVCGAVSYVYETFLKRSK